MSHRKSVIAILMALVMVFVSAPVGMAGGPGSSDWTDVQTDGGDGHPWDDGTSGNQSNPPDDDPDMEAEPIPDQQPELLMTASVSPFLSWYTSAVHHLWRVIKAEIKQTRVYTSHKKVRRVR